MQVCFAMIAVALPARPCSYIAKVFPELVQVSL